VTGVHISIRSILNAAPFVVLLWLIVGAQINFTPDPTARRDGRSFLIAVGFWAIIAASIRTPVGPLWLASCGLVGLAASLALFQWATHSIRGRHFSYIWSKEVPDFLHTSGPYAHVRNPFYASYLLAFVSTAIVHPGILTGLVVVAMLFYFDMAARLEERKFEASPLRDEYLAYKSRTGRFVPRPR
jgi:protein-S-isoprenylcysteine O-methyltransferase Ste14